MNQVPAPLTDFATRLLAHEAGESRTAADLVAAIERGCDSLHAQLAPLVSSAGFHALLARAVTLAARDFSFLAVVNATVLQHGCLEGLREATESRPAKEVERALIAILATFIWLLIIFIGETIGLRKVHEVWPDVPFTPSGSSSTKA
jgi:hypothetical protein